MIKLGCIQKNILLSDDKGDILLNKVNDNEINNVDETKAINELIELKELCVDFNDYVKSQRTNIENLNTNISLSHENIKNGVKDLFLILIKQ